MIQFLVSKTALLEGLNCVASALPVRSSLPYLTNVLLETQKDKLLLVATDLDTTITTTIPVSVSTAGSITLPGKKFLEIVRELPSGDIRMNGTGNRMVITCGKASFNLSGSSSDQFPAVPKRGEGKSITISIEQISAAINKTSYAVAKNHYKAMLNGVLMNINSGGFDMVATDAHRLSHIHLPSITSSEETSALIDPKALNLFVKLSGENEVTIYLKGTQISFEFGDTAIFSRIIDGEYPDYQKIIPRNNEHSLEIERDEIISVLRRVRTMANPSTHQVKFLLEPGNITLHTESSDAGEATEALEAEYNGDSFQIGFNGEFLMELFRKMSCEKIVMKMKDSGTAVVIQDLEMDETIETYLALIMPVKLATISKPEEK